MRVNEHVMMSSDQCYHCAIQPSTKW